MIDHTADEEYVREQAIELAQKYRRVFGTGEGREVLHDILLDLSMYGNLSNQELVHRHNIARVLLSKIGGQIDQDLSVITDAYLSMPIGEPTVQE